LDVTGSSPEAFAAHIKREDTKWARVVKDAGIKAGQEESGIDTA